MPRKGTQSDFIQEQLERWGAAVINRYARYYDGPSAGDSVLAKQRDLGLRSRRKQEDERKLVGRDGRSRLARMGEAASSDPEATDSARGARLQMDAVPSWACDPVPAKNDASPPRTISAAYVDHGIPDELRWVEREVAALGRQFPIREKILRAEFTTTGSQAVKARRVEDEYGGKLTLRQYRYELYKGIDWLRAREAA